MRGRDEESQTPTQPRGLTAARKRLLAFGSQALIAAKMRLLEINATDTHQMRTRNRVLLGGPHLGGPLVGRGGFPLPFVSCFLDWRLGRPGGPCKGAAQRARLPGVGRTASQPPGPFRAGGLPCGLRPRPCPLGLLRPFRAARWPPPPCLGGPAACGRSAAASGGVLASLAGSPGAGLSPPPGPEASPPPCFRLFRRRPLSLPRVALSCAVRAGEGLKAPSPLRRLRDAKALHVRVEARP